MKCELTLFIGGGGEGGWRNTEGNTPAKLQINVQDFKTIKPVGFFVSTSSLCH